MPVLYKTYRKRGGRWKRTKTISEVSSLGKPYYKTFVDRYNIKFVRLSKSEVASTRKRWRKHKKRKR